MNKQKRHDKLIVERQRRGSGNKYHDYRHIKGNAINDDFFDFEEDDINMAAPRLLEPMRRPYKQYYAEKEFSDFTSPIKGFVRKNVGRKWNEVFSEFCAEYDQRAIINKHLFDHLKQNVCRKVYEVNGELQVRTRWQVKPLKDSYEEYYVDPRDGILKRNNDYADWKQHRREYNLKAQQERDKNRKVVDRFHEYHLMDGIWFLVTFIELPGERVRTSTYSYYSKRANYYYAVEYQLRYDILKKEVVSGKRYAASRRTASKKEIRDFHLNEPIEIAA